MLCAIEIAAASVSVGALPSGLVAAPKRLLHASTFTRVVQPATTSDSVLKFAIVGVWVLFRASWIMPPYPPVARSTKLATLPAAMRRPSAFPLIAVPSRNWAWVQTDATVVISLIVTLAGGVLPSTVISAIAGLLVAALLTAGLPPVATRYSEVSWPTG